MKAAPTALILLHTATGQMLINPAHVACINTVGLGDGTALLYVWYAGETGDKQCHQYPFKSHEHAHTAMMRLCE